MEIGCLTPGNLSVFRPLLLPETARALERGEPLTALGLTEGRVALGAAAGYLAGRRFRVTSLYVAPDYRRRGGGRLLIEKLVLLCRFGADSLVLRFTATEEEHHTLPPFLEHMGFFEEDDHGENLYQIKLEQVARTDFFSARGARRGVPFAQLSQEVLSGGERAALVAQAPIPEGGLNGGQVDREVSMAHLENGRIQAYVVCDTSWSGGLTLSALWSQSQDNMVLPGLLRSALSAAVEKYPPDTALVMQAVNQRSAALLRTLLPQAEPISHAYLLHFAY